MYTKIKIILIILSFVPFLTFGQTGWKNNLKQNYSDTSTYDATKNYVNSAIGGAGSQAKTDTSTYDATKYFVINRFQQDSDTTSFDATKTYVQSNLSSVGFDPSTTFEIFEEFDVGTALTGAIGRYRWNLFRLDGTEVVSIDDDETNHPGTFKWSTHNPSTVTLYSTHQYQLVNDGFFEAIISLGSVSATSQSFIGIGSGTNAFRLIDFSDAVGIEYLSGGSANWQYGCRKDGTGTPSISSIAATTGYHKIKFVVNSGRTSVEFFVDGVSLGSVSTNIPTDATDIMYLVNGGRDSGGGLANHIIDYIWYKGKVTR